MTAPALTWSENRLLRHGRPHRILAGSMHYFRVHPGQWRDRMLRLADLGLNTVDTYVAWNFHQSDAGTPPDFTGWRDLERFVQTAAETGLDVLLRPGPYICAEWTGGGLPVWLTGSPAALRTCDPRFMEPVTRWFEQLLPKMAPLQAAHGGPIVAVQVENEYGSYGDDPQYVAAVRDLLLAGGITELLYTADGPTPRMVAAGALEGTLMGLNFGSRVAESRAFGRARRPDEPFVVGEFWNGWFDHWGEPHHVRDPRNAAQTVAEIVQDGGSVSIYMAHGGSNFGDWAGSNHDGLIQPTVTSYDSDAPIAEDGRYTEKFFAIRDALGVDEPLRAAEPVFVPETSVELTSGPDLLSAVRVLASAPREVFGARSADELGWASPFTLYEAEVWLDVDAESLHFEQVADRAHVFLDGQPLGEIVGAGALPVSGTGALARLTVVVESFGHVNFGPHTGGAKGLLGPVHLDRRIVQRWRVSAVPLREAGAEGLRALVGSADRAGSAGSADSADRAAHGPGVAWGTFELAEPADAHLTVHDFGRGFVWVNSFLLGRHWRIGPQRTLYVPAPLLRQGANEIVVLDVERRGRRASLGAQADLGPVQEFVEEL